MSAIAMPFLGRIVLHNQSHQIMRLFVLLYAMVDISIVIAAEESRFDNSVAGVPVISCERDHITVTIETTRPFAGKIFVKGEYSNRKCMRAYVNGFPLPSDETLLSPARKRPAFPDENPAGAGMEGSREAGGDYLDSAEVFPSPQQASHFLSESDLLVSDQVKSGNVHQNAPDSANFLASSKWSGYGGVSSSDHHGLPYVGAFGGSLREEMKTTETPGLKVFQKSKVDVSDGVLTYPGPQGLTAANCPLKCDPCSCEKEKKVAERRRRDTNTVELTVPLGACNAKRDRKMSPPTLTVSFVAIISFHDSFITKLDRAYRIQCAYVETNKSLSTQLDVDTLAPAQLNGTAPPPVCAYHISGASGQEIHNVRVGEQVKHEWICTSSVPKLYAMLVHSCYIEDGAGQRYQVIDEHGCSLDDYILKTPNYYPDGLRATVDAFMMKFPDKSSVDFQCAIEVCSKFDQNCTAITPPDCSSRSNHSRRRRRAAPAESDFMTLHANSLTVLDADVAQDIPRSLASTSDPWLPSVPSEFCLSIAGFGVLVSASTFLATVAFAIAAANTYIGVQYRNGGKKSDYIM